MKVYLISHRNVVEDTAKAVKTLTVATNKARYSADKLKRAFHAMKVRARKGKKWR